MSANVLQTSHKDKNSEPDFYGWARQKLMKAKYQVKLAINGNNDDENNLCWAKKHYSGSNLIMSIDVCNRWPIFSFHRLLFEYYDYKTDVGCLSMAMMMIFVEMFN